MNNKTSVSPFMAPKLLGFCLFFCFFFPGTEDKRSNIITKDAPIALTAQEISVVLGACEPGLWMKTKCVRNIFWSSE